MLKQKQFILEKELIAHAAKYLSTPLDPTYKNNPYSSYEAATQALGSFPLTLEFIAFLEKNGFGVGNGTGDCANMFYVTDRACGNTVVAGVYNSHNWAWDRKKTDEESSYQFNPTVILSVNPEERGVELTPKVSGNNSGGPVWEKTIRRMAWAIATPFPYALPVIKMFAASQNDTVILPFSDFGCAGIKSVDDLFREYFNSNNAVCELVQTQISPFTPRPYIDYQEKARGSMFFLPERLHGALRKQWQEQLESYRSSLAS